MKLFEYIKSRIRYKFILASTVISFFVIIVSYFGLSTIDNIEKGYVQISRKSVPIMQQLNTMNFACLRLISSATEYAFIQTASRNGAPSGPIEQETSLIQSSCKSCHEAFSEYKRLVSDSFPGETSHTKNIASSAIQLQKISIEFVEMNKRGIYGKPILEKKEEMEKAEIDFLNTVNVSITHITNRLEDEKSLLDLAISSSYTNIIGFSILTLLISIMVGILFSRSITAPLIKLTHQTDKFRTGNFDAHIEITSGDEIGILSRGFNEMAGKIKDLITQLRNEVDITRKNEEILKRNASRFKLLNDIGSKIAGTLQLDQILDNAVNMIQENFEYNHVSLLTYNEQEDSVVIKSIAGDFVRLFKSNSKIKLEKGIVLWSAKKAEIAIANNVKADSRYVNIYPDMINTRSELCIPLKIKDKVFGILDVQSKALNAFQEEDINILVNLADQITLAINNSLLYEEGQAELVRRINAENETKKRNHQLLKLNAEKDKFFSIIAHDLRSPFHGLLGLTDMVATDSSDFSREEFVQYCKTIHDTSFSLFKLIENLLSWSQMQSGKMTFTPKTIDLKEIILYAIESIRDRGNNKEISIINNLQNSIYIFADENMINSVMRNLLSNAIKFTSRKGKVVINSKILDNKKVEVSVNDNGIGLSEANVRKLFKVEEKVSSKGTEGEPSTGLGLLLCKEFVGKNGGDIWVESEENKGSTFYFTLLLAEAEQPIS